MIDKKNLQANIDYHTALVEIYDESQPHFRKENKEKVSQILKRIALKTGGKRLLDLGCGTGFIMELALPYFDEVYGVDITPAMLDEARKKFAKKKGKKIELIESSTDKMPFKNSTFDVLTGYSFLHHLSSILPTLKESYRVLKKGGIFYSDLDPNFYFWQAIKNISKEKNVSDLMKADIRTVCNMTEDVSAMVKGLDAETVKNSEIIESKEGGFKEEEIINLFRKAGFKKIDLIYHWFWQEGKVINDLSPKVGTYFEDHLRLGLPATRHLFKYFRIEAVK